MIQKGSIKITLPLLLSPINQIHQKVHEYLTTFNRVASQLYRGEFANNISPAIRSMVIAWAKRLVDKRDNVNSLFTSSTFTHRRTLLFIGRGIERVRKNEISSITQWK